ncbi:MAG: MBL fold metallo-hydrolase [Candidatus Thorarchaeota archaeon]|nr:MBL fold metallo-hydrolase [Candidatus Thorarchaeota archaeon]
MIEIVQFNEDITCVKTATEQDGNAIMFVYAFLVRDALFDAGCANAIDEIREFARKNEINDVYITHSHEDHCGCCTVFEKTASIFATPATQEILRKPPFYGEFFNYVWGQPEPVSDLTDLPKTFSIGDLRFEVVPVPGHTMEMVGFYEPEKKWFFSADAVPLPSKKRIAMPDENIPQMVATMEKILTMDIDILFDSHRGAIHSPQKHIQTRIDYIIEIQQKAKELHESGKSIEEMQQILELEGPWYLELTKGRFGIDFFLKSVLFDKVVV